MKFKSGAVFFCLVFISLHAAQPNQPASGDGTSPARAVKIQAASVEDGYSQEKAWVEKHRPSLTFHGIRMELLNDVAYDVLTAATPLGEPNDIYFDASVPAKLQSLPHAQPSVISQPDVEYPSALKKAGIAGGAIVQFTVEKDGSVSGAFAVRQTRREFGRAVIEGVKRWTFHPGLKYGTPVRMILQVPVSFSPPVADPAPQTQAGKR